MKGNKMAEITKSTKLKSFGSDIQRLSLAKPILVIVLLFLIMLLFRWIDGFVFRLDEIIGELFLTKSLGFGLVLCFLWLTGHKVKDIGLHSAFLPQSLAIGIASTTIAFIVGFGVEIFFVSQGGNQPVLLFGAIDSKMGVTGGILFALWLLLGNFVNSFMEEGFFRGLTGRLARIRFNLWGVNWFQAAIFSVWHLPWVLKYYQLGDIETPGEIATSIFFHSIPQLLIGIVYGYYYLKTNSLWAPWAAHAMSNITLNFWHVDSLAGFDSGIPIRMGVYSIVMLLSLFWVKQLTKKYHMQEVRPWE
jgi:membrane protease YdiL (CAAX protease family)